MEYSDPVEYEVGSETVERLAMTFPSVEHLRYAPETYEYASQGMTLGATPAVVTVRSNRTFYVTGARIDNPEIELTEVGGDPAGDGFVSYSYHDPASPTAGHDVLEPVQVQVSLRPDLYGGLNVIEVPAGGSSVFEMGFGIRISLWTYADADRDTVPFPEDEDEVIHIRASLFLEGYLADGTEFSGAFPPPLSRDMVIIHVPDPES